MTQDTLTQDTLTQGEPWMTPHERDLNQDLIRAIAGYLKTAGVPENPLVALRVNDIASTWLLARRLESALAPADGGPAPCPTPAQANAIGRCRERLRKAIKELEEYAAKNGAPAPQGLVEQMHDAVRIVRATGRSTDNLTPINPNGDPEIENQTTEKPGKPNPKNNAPEKPGSPNPADNAPGVRQRIHAEIMERYRAGQPPRPAPATRRSNFTPNDIPRMPPRPEPPQDTG